ncbi:hypothetical protein SVIO_058630 [Streptomyces violaceusniger]|uniref:GntR C-terminal domain-containing protein n=1 Tax=Streptomyces violaceusniger TaxID=68280 RepID=A0A4D4L896_STRVO|nr:hypothetical protein SVIO_058630 [Streptomyces violaceusniger]
MPTACARNLEAIVREEHHRLVALIADGRAPEAAQLMRDHITHSLTATTISALEDRESHRHH